MLECLLAWLFLVLVMAIVIWGIKLGLAALEFSVPNPIWTLLCLIVGLIALLKVLPCLQVHLP